MMRFFPSALTLCVTSLVLLACTAPTPLPSTPSATPTPTASPSATDSAPPAAEAEAAAVLLSAFEQEFAETATSYQGALKMLFKALLVLEDAPEVAEHLVALTLNGKKMYPSESSPTGYDVGNSTRFILQQLQQKPQIARSYLGGTPAAGYADFDGDTLPLNFPANGSVIGEVKVDNTLEAPGAGEGRVYLLSNGKDLPTPISLERNGQGLWKIDPSSLSSLATGVKAAESGDF